MGGRINLKTWVVMSVFLLGMCWVTALGDVIYVQANAPPGGDGQTWGTAYKYLQDALYKPPTSGDEIWVAEGTYYPDEDEGANVDPNDRTETFQLINGVTIKGGYAGVGASDPNEHDIELYETILSGDINTPGDNSDNSYHVVTGSGTYPTAILDGFTITAGNANGSNPYDRGGGMYNYVGSPTVRNCNYIGNSADDGGGMYNDFSSNPTVMNCTFSENAGYKGGGMYNGDSSSPTLTNCTFSSNQADGYHVGGGGMYNEDSDPTLTNCTFSGNTGYKGGGMQNQGSNPTVTNCTFSYNWASRGGGMHNGGNSRPIVTNCTFSPNAAIAGGGMQNQGSNPTVTNCTFSANLSPDAPSFVHPGGAGMGNESSSPTVTNCTFSGNSAGTYGGGMCNRDNSSPTLTNSILWDNTAPSAPQIYIDGTSSVTVSYSDVQGGNGGTGNINADPCFVDADGPDNIVGTEDDNLRLLAGSPCIDAGDNTAVPAGVTTDLDGRPRFVDGDCNNTEIVDMGAYEFGRSDINNNGNVNFVDFAILAAHWPETSCDVCGGADLTCDGDVDFYDLKEFADNWLAGLGN